MWTSPSSWSRKRLVKKAFLKSVRVTRGFENSMFEPGGSGTLCSNPGSGNSMFEPRVRKLSVRTPGSGTLCSNSGFGNSMFEPWARELYVRTPETLSSNPGCGISVRTLGSGTLCSNPGFGNSMFELHISFAINPEAIACRLLPLSCSRKHFYSRFLRSDFCGLLLRV